MYTPMSDQRLLDIENGCLKVYPTVHELIAEIRHLRKIIFDEQTDWERYLGPVLPEHMDIDPIAVSRYIERLVERVGDVETF